MADNRTRAPLPVFGEAKDLLEAMRLTVPSVDAKAVAGHFGYRVSVEASPNDLHVAVSPSEKLILVDKRLDRQLQNYAVAFALGHATLHPQLRHVFTAKFGDAELTGPDVKAHLFAVELLVPRNWLLARLGTFGRASLIRLFDVPERLLKGAYEYYGFRW